MSSHLLAITVVVTVLSGGAAIALHRIGGRVFEWSRLAMSLSFGMSLLLLATDVLQDKGSWMPRRGGKVWLDMHDPPLLFWCIQALLWFAGIALIVSTARVFLARRHSSPNPRAPE